jgi:serine/threonine protein phosphatase PrpC
LESEKLRFGKLFSKRSFSLCSDLARIAFTPRPAFFRCFINDEIIKLKSRVGGTSVAIIRSGRLSPKEIKAMIKYNFYNQASAEDLRLEVFGLSDAGHKRATNEDAFLVADINGDCKFLAVADGFSGAGGAEASRLAVNELRELLLMPSAWNVAERLRAAMKIVGGKIEKHFEKTRDANSPGTTLTAAYVSGGTAHIAHVGNSRAYLVRGGEIRQLTVDHTFAQVMTNQGIEPSAAAKKTLLQALGIECELSPLVAQIELRADDYLLLCSDGFSNSVEAEGIARIVAANADVSVAVERLIETANERDGGDNITIVLARACRAVKAGATFRSITLKAIGERRAA